MVAFSTSLSARETSEDIQVQVHPAPVHHDVSLEQGLFLIRQREYGLAVNLLRKIVRHDPGNARAYNAMAVAYDGLGRADLARTNFELAIAHAPRDEKSYRNLARHLKANGKARLAVMVMEDFIRTGIRKNTPEAGHEMIQPLVSIAPTPDLIHTTEIAELVRLSVDEILPESPSPSPSKEVETTIQAILPEQESATKVMVSEIVASSGNGNGADDEDGRDFSFSRASGANEDFVKPATLEDLDEVLAKIYAGIGQPLFGTETDLAPRSERAIALDHMETELRALALREQETGTRSRHIPQVQISYRPDRKKAAPIRTGFHLYRQSLGTVMLKTKAANVDVQPRFLARSMIDVGTDSSTRSSGAMRYFAAVSSILEKAPNSGVESSSKIRHAIVLKQLDLALTDLKRKQWSRLPRLDQGPSSEMQKIAGTIYRLARFRLEPKIQLADFDVRLTHRMKVKRQCVA